MKIFSLTIVQNGQIFQETNGGLKNTPSKGLIGSVCVLSIMFIRVSPCFSRCCHHYKHVANPVKKADTQTGAECLQCLLGFDTVTRHLFLPLSTILLCPSLCSLFSHSHHDGLSMKEPSVTLCSVLLGS